MRQAVHAEGAPAREFLFDDEFLRILERLALVSRRAFASQHRGNRTSRARAHGLEFADHRGYAAGDDFRRIDWNASKRLNRLLIRLYDEERDLPVYVFLDTSASMAEPSSKFDQARRIAAALCYLALAKLDRVTLLPFGDRPGTPIVPGRGKAQIFGVFRALERLEMSGDTSLDTVFAEFARQRAPRGVAVVLSDFLDPIGFEPGLRRLAALGHDTFAAHLTSTTDDQAGPLGEVRFEDAETGAFEDIDLTPAMAGAYARAWARHTADLERYCARNGLAYVHADTDQPVEEVILRTFRLGGVVT